MKKLIELALILIMPINLFGLDNPYEKKFSKEVSDKLKYYVYIYSHPITNKIFYVGKGEGNRVFDHLKDKEDNEKVKIINELKEQGLSPKIEILIHGLQNEDIAFKVETAVIDLLGVDNLTNIQNGHGSEKIGRMSIKQIKSIYNKEDANITEPVVMIKLTNHFKNQMSDLELYEATRSCWQVNTNKKPIKPKYALSIHNDIIQEVYEIAGWHKAGSTFFSTRKDIYDDDNCHNRREFVGKIANEEIRKKYKFKSVKQYYKKGNANPIQYLNIKK